MISNAYEQDFVEETASTVKPYHYTGCGLPNVYLVGVKFKAYNDGEQSAEIPSLPDLLKAIATALVGKATPLTGDEVRFLRKRMGFSSKAFAEIIGTNPQHYSRLENSVVPLNVQTERLIRLLYSVTARLPKVAQKVATTRWEAGFDQKQNIIASKDTSHIWHVQFDVAA